MTCPFNQPCCPKIIDFSHPYFLCPPTSAVGTYAVRDDVGVAVQGLLGVTVLRLVTGEIPDDQGLVTGAGQEHVGAIARCVSKSGQSRRFHHSCSSYFSMEVAKLVTQPLCKDTQVSLTARDLRSKFCRYQSVLAVLVVAGQVEGITSNSCGGNLRDPRGYP